MAKNYGAGAGAGANIFDNLEAEHSPGSSTLLTIQTEVDFM
jgi:hypothetical protein